MLKHRVKKKRRKKKKKKTTILFVIRLINYIFHQEKRSLTKGYAMLDRMSLPIAGSGSDNAQSRIPRPTRDEIDEKPWYVSESRENYID